MSATAQTGCWPQPMTIGPDDFPVLQAVPVLRTGHNDYLIGYDHDISVVWLGLDTVLSWELPGLVLRVVNEPRRVGMFIERDHVYFAALANHLDDLGGA